MDDFGHFKTEDFFLIKDSKDNVKKIQIATQYLQCPKRTKNQSRICEGCL